MVQLLETPLLCLVSYARWGPPAAARGRAGARTSLPGAGPGGCGCGAVRWVRAPPWLRRGVPRSLAPHSLIATNAARLRLIAGPEKRLLEMGLRRAQGPDGGLTASTYSYLGGKGQGRAGRQSGRPGLGAPPPHGTRSPNPARCSGPGFDGSSNVLAGQLRGVPVAGTLAHSFVTSFSGTEVPPDPVSTLLCPAELQRTDSRACPCLGEGRSSPCSAGADHVSGPPGPVGR